MSPRSFVQLSPDHRPVLMHDGKPVGTVKRIVPRYPLGPGIPVYDAEGHWGDFEKHARSAASER